MLILQYEMQSFPLVSSFPVLEGTLSAMLQMVALKDLNDSRINTTLLSPEFPITNNHQNTLVLSITLEGYRVPLKERGTKDDSCKQKAWNSLWKNFPHEPFGIKAGVPIEISKATSSKAEGPLLKRMDTRTGQWIQQIDISQHEDAFKAESQAQDLTLQEQQEVSTDQQPLEPTSIPTKPSTRRARVPKGASKLATTSALENLIPAMMSLWTPPITSIGTLQTAPEILQTTSPEIKHGEAQPYIDERRNKVLGESTLGSPTAKGNEQSDDNAKVPPINDLPTSLIWQENTDYGARGGIRTELEKNSADSIRKNSLRRTMGQKRPRKPLSISKTEFIRSFEVSASQILDLALTCPWSVKLKVAIGRFLIDPQSVKLKRPFAFTELASVLPTKQGIHGVAAQTVFTPRLTTRSVDADAILDLKLPQGQRLFDNDPHERTVTYIISCRSKANEQVVIEIDEDSSFTMEGSELLVGALDWHFPLRSWDARLGLTTQDLLMGNYQQQAQAIVSSMTVTVDPQRIDFSCATVDQEVRPLGGLAV